MIGKKDKKHIKHSMDAVKQLLNETIDTLVETEDLEGIEDFISVVELFTSGRLLKALDAKGFSKEIRELCTKAGIKETMIQ